MKLQKFTVYFAVFLLLGSMIGTFSTQSVEISDLTPIFGVTEGTQMVYELNTVEYNGTNSWTINNEDGMGSYEIGSINTGDMFFIRVNHLPDLNNPSELNVYTELRGSQTTESWDHQYEYAVLGWPEEFNGPPFFMPVATIPEVASDWTTIEADWNAQTDFTATYDDLTNTFRLQSSGNTTLNVTGLDVTWNTLNGVMVHYFSSGTEGEQNVPFTLEMSFLYFRDEAEWDLNWGIEEGTSIAFKWENFEGTDSIEFGSDEFETNYVYENDLMLFNINELADLTQSGPFWNGSIKTTEFETEFNFEFADIGQNDGPLTWYPILPVGNDAFVGNISDEFEALGASVTVSNNILNISITYDGNSESARWDLTTGIMQQLIYDGEVGDEITAYLEMRFIYQFNSGGEPIFTGERFEERYIMDDIGNGTRDYLDFGDVDDYVDENGNEVRRQFMLHEGDIMQTQIEFEERYDDETDQYEEQWYWYGRTSSGFEIDARMTMGEPGFEVQNDGPPALIYVIPTRTTTISGDAWWNLLEDVYMGLEYNIVNTATEFGISTTLDDLTVTTRWDKTTGLLNYYNVTGIDGDTDNEVWWVMHRSQYNIRDATGLNWGVGAGTSMNYTFSDIITPIEFGEGGSIQNGDIMEVTFRHLGNLQDEGPMVWVDMQVGTQLEENVSMGLRNPGFEFVSFENEDEDGGPPLLYFAIPIGPTSFWTNVAGMYSDAGYSVINNATHLSITLDRDNVLITSIWEKSTGLMVYYHMDGTIDGQTLVFTAIQVSSDVVETTPTSSNTGDGSSEAEGPTLPFSKFYILAIFVSTYMTRRKYKN